MDSGVLHDCLLQAKLCLRHYLSAAPVRSSCYKTCADFGQPAVRLLLAKPKQLCLTLFTCATLGGNDQVGVTCLCPELSN